jgi:hypothetical protein
MTGDCSLEVLSSALKGSPGRMGPVPDENDFTGSGLPCECGPVAMGGRCAARTQSPLSATRGG